MSQDFDDSDYWKGIILFGINAATYKMGLARSLLGFAREGRNTVLWHELADSFFDQYTTRLIENRMPQQGYPTRLTVMERIVKEFEVGKLSRTSAVERVGQEAFKDVVPRFQTIGTNKDIVAGHFYEFDKGKHLKLKDTLLAFTPHKIEELDSEIVARWSLLEGAFSIGQSQFELANDIREIYLANGYKRKQLTSNIPFLKGYQGNVCFYCGEPLGCDVHVDHVLPRQFICHDEVWNLVLSHGVCNGQKLDRLIGPHFIQKLIARNENIMGSNHPWKQKIAKALGKTSAQRARVINRHYEDAKVVLGSNYWGGSNGYNPASDPFFRRLITVLNNKS